MTNREKVIKGISVCINTIHTGCPIGCPYYEQCTKRGDCNVFQPMLRDALALLKEQEAVEPVPEHPVVINTLACGACHAQVARWDMFPRMSRDAKRVYLFRAKYCPECGRKVKWEEK